jgi:hypothetical protein
LVVADGRGENKLFLQQLLIPVAAAVRGTSVTAEERGVELCGGGLRPFRVVWVVMAKE